MKAMLLAAGLGTRMRPLTDSLPKPLLPLGGRALMDHALDRLEAAGVTEVVVNGHWQSERIEAYLAGRGRGPRTVFVPESALLDTGGSVRDALGLLGEEPFFVLNGDAFWLDGPTPALERLRQMFDPARHDATLLVVRSAQVAAAVGAGDFAVDPWGVPRRPKEMEIVPYVYSGIQIAAPALFADAPEGAFSMNRLWDRAIAAGRLNAVVHDGLWFHLSTPQDLADAEFSLQARAVGEGR